MSLGLNGLIHTGMNYGAVNVQTVISFIKMKAYKKPAEKEKTRAESEEERLRKRRFLKITKPTCNVIHIWLRGIIKLLRVLSINFELLLRREAVIIKRKYAISYAPSTKPVKYKTKSGRNLQNVSVSRTDNQLHLW